MQDHYQLEYLNQTLSKVDGRAAGAGRRVPEPWLLCRANIANKPPLATLGIGQPARRALYVPKHSRHSEASAEACQIDAYRRWSCIRRCNASLDNGPPQLQQKNNQFRRPVR